VAPSFVLMENVTQIHSHLESLAGWTIRTPDKTRLSLARKSTFIALKRIVDSINADD
jgi:hypothetical protein